MQDQRSQADQKQTSDVCGPLVELVLLLGGFMIAAYCWILAITKLQTMSAIVVCAMTGVGWYVIYIISEEATDRRNSEWARLTYVDRYDGIDIDRPFNENFVLSSPAAFPPIAKWQEAIDKLGVPLQLKNIVEGDKFVRIAAVFDGGETDFRCRCFKMEELPLIDDDIAQEREQAIAFLTRLDLYEFQAGMYAAAALSGLLNGMFYHSECEVLVPTTDIVPYVQKMIQENIEERNLEADGDREIARQVCPRCQAPRPGYRKTCKGCGLEFSSR